MSLINIDTSNNYLDAVGGDGIAISKPIVQPTGENISESSVISNRIVTPTMTANTSGGVTVSTKNADTDPYRLFNRLQANSGHSWYSNINVTTGVEDWIQIELDTPQIIDNLKFRTAANDNAPAAWTFEGSHDGINWTVLDTVSGQSINQYADSPLYTFTNNTVYAYYRMVITATKVDNKTVGMMELWLYGLNGDRNILKTSALIIDGEALVIEKDDGTFYDIIASGVTGSGPYTMDTSSITAGEVPSRVYKKETFVGNFSQITNITMDLEFANISNSIAIPPLIIATADHSSDVSATGTIANEHRCTLARGLFDRTTTTQIFATSNSMATYGPSYFTYQFLNPTKIERIEIQNAASSYAPRNFYIEASHDNINWIRIVNVTSNTTQGSNLWHNYDIDPVLADDYIYYRFVFVSSWGNWVELREIYLKRYAEIVDQNLLKTTDLVLDGDKIAIVKEDDSVYPIIVNGIVNTFSDVNYIPDMTSNTTPSGIASASSDYGVAYAPWQAFDRYGSGNWTAAYPATGNQWVQYEFPEPITPYKYSVQIVNSITRSPLTWQLQGSNNGIDYTTIDSISNNIWTEVYEKQYFNITTPGSYTHFRIYITGYDGSWLAITEIALYINEITSSELDTTSITNGEVPSRVYKMNDTIKFNGKEPWNPKDIFSVATDLKSTRTYDDISINARSIETTVELSAGNKMTRLSADVSKKL